MNSIKGKKIRKSEENSEFGGEDNSEFGIRRRREFGFRISEFGE